MPIVPFGSTNLAGQGIPNVIVQTLPPRTLLNGVATDIIGVVGIATDGPVNAPYAGSMQQIFATFGNPTINKYDLGTQVFTANKQGANSFICVRVTDGTDVAASIALLDTHSPVATAAVLTAIYTGTGGNSINAVISIGTSYTPSVPTYKLSIYKAGGIAEVYDNIGGTGNTFWTNLVNAVNNGQSTFRGPSQIVIASLTSGIGGVTITVPGSYTAIPTLTATVGTGAVLQPVMKAVTVTAVAAGGTLYSVNDTITLSGGTKTTATILTVSSVSGGAVTGVTISTAGAYTALPSNPVAQASSSSSGTGATFTMAWGLSSVNVTTPGTGYNISSVLNVSAGTGAGTLSVGSISVPDQESYTASGGTDGNTGVTDADLIGDDTSSPRTGMYAFRSTPASILILADADDPTYWTDQVAYTLGGDLPYMINTIAPGYQENIAGATTILQTAAIDTPFFKLSTGDWEQLNDPYNSQTRYVSPQGYIAGLLASQLPSNSSLNKAMQGIVATQKTADSRIYSDTELYQLETGRLEVITKPIPLSKNAFGCRTGVNTSSNSLTNEDNYPRMIYFLGQTILQGMGLYIGQPQTPSLQSAARATLTSFLNEIWQLGMIGYATDAQKVPYQVVLDGTNNPQDRVALGFMQADVTVILLSIVLNLIINLDANQNSTIQISNPIPVQ